MCSGTARRWRTRYAVSHPRAQIGSFRVLNAALGSKFPIIREAASLAVDMGYQILNCSFGSGADLSRIEHFKPWVDLAYRRGVHIVSACNNDDFRSAEWPGHFPSVVTVNMAKTESDDLYFRWDEPEGDFSRHLVEFAARGVDLRGAVETREMDGAIRQQLRRAACLGAALPFAVHPSIPQAAGRESPAPGNRRAVVARHARAESLSFI
jgi:subtilisin